MNPESYTRLYLWLLARRRWVIAFTLLFAIAGIFISLPIDLEENILAILPEGDPLVEDYRYAVRKFRQIDRVYIDVGANSADADTLARAADEVYAQLTKNPAYTRIMYRLEMAGQQRLVDFFTGALPNLFTEADEKALAAKLDPTEVREFLTVMRRKLAGPEGMVLKDVVAADP